MPASRAPLLLIAATRGEVEPLLARLDGSRPLPLRYGAGEVGLVEGSTVAVAILGVGKVNTAAGLALALADLEPAAVVQVGIGGSFPSAQALLPGCAAVADEEVHLDSGAGEGSEFEDLTALGFPLLTEPIRIYNRVPLDHGFAAALAGGLVPQVPFGTSERVTASEGRARDVAARFGVAIESMEGAAAAQVCLALRVPFAEVRGVSNFVGVRDKAGWRLAEAVSAADEVVKGWLERGAPLE